MRNKTVDLMADVNDHRNGLFSGRIEAIQLSRSDLYMELEGLSRCVDTGVHLRIAGRVYPYTDKREWVGNWVWNQYKISIETAVQLLGHLYRLKSWEMVEAPPEIHQVWNDGRPITSEMLKG